MAKLSHIEDFEDGGASGRTGGARLAGGGARPADGAMRSAGQMGEVPSASGSRNASRSPEGTDAASSTTSGVAPTYGGLPRTASDELAWHGLDEREGGGGHKIIVAVALVVLAAVVLYVLNYWLHIF